MAKTSRQANGGGGGGPTIDADAAVAFLELLRPGGPWTLTAIIPDGKTRTVTFSDTDAVKQFILLNNPTCNLYFAVNPLRHAVSKKASKAEIAAVEFVHADLDPLATETPEEAKTRYRAELEKLWLKPFFLIDSGNGLQGLWRLEVPTTDFAAVEARSLALMLKLGATPGPQNVDRILRLPGTINHPNAVKLKAGRVPCAARLLEHNDVRYLLDIFPEPPQKQQKQQKQGKTTKLPKNAAALLYLPEPGSYKTRSELLFAFLLMALRAGVSDGDIADACFDTAHEGCAIFEHIADQKADGRAYLARQIQRARDKIGAAKAAGFEVDKDGNPIARSQRNIRLALKLLNFDLSYDEFHDRVLINGTRLDDPALERTWLMIDERFDFLPPLEFYKIVLIEAARRNSFHPVRDFLDGLKWDGTPRLERWLTTYGGADDTKYTRAVSKLTLVAAVRRIRHPGCKFDETGTSTGYRRWVQGAKAT